MPKGTPGGGGCSGLNGGHGLGRCSGQIHPQQIRQHVLIDLGTLLGLRMIVRQGAARAGFGPDLGPILGPVLLGIDGGVGREHGPVKLLVGEPKPRRAFVVEIRERALFQPGILRGAGHDGGLPTQRPGLGRNAHRKGEACRVADRAVPSRSTVYPAWDGLSGKHASLAAH